MQYGSSHLVNTMETYRKIKDWQSHSRDMVESFKRYYHNSFLDSQRQEAYNLFLGNYIYAQGQPMLWDLSTDYYLHHTDPQKWHEKVRHNYQQWYNPASLEAVQMPVMPTAVSKVNNVAVNQVDDYWIEYYRPLALSSLLKVFAFNMNSTTRHTADRFQVGSGFHDFSPFQPRKPSIGSENAEGKNQKRSSTTLEVYDDLVSVLASTPSSRPATIAEDMSPVRRAIIKETYFELERHLQPLPEATSAPTDTSDKKFMHQWTLNRIYTESLNPKVSAAETAEYEDYVNHPSNLRLATVNKDTIAAAGKEFSKYIDLDNDQGPEFNHTDAIEGTDIQDFLDYLSVAENPLNVNEEDGGKKRYKAYSKWLRGKSFFKQSSLDPEFAIAH